MIHPATRIGAVHLTIADLRRSVRFYETHLGFTVRRRDERTAWLGAGGRDLLILSQCEAAPRVRGTTGLYHFAILVPSRIDLAHALRRLVATGTIMQGAADHGVSEALYLADEDGNGIEIYRDRPRDRMADRRRPAADGRRPGRSRRRCSTRAGAPTDAAGLPAGTVIGHVHLHVSRLRAGARVLRRRPRVRVDAALRPERAVRRRGRLPPSHRPEHVGRRRRAAASARRDRPQTFRRRAARRGGASHAVGRTRCTARGLRRSRSTTGC